MHGVSRCHIAQYKLSSSLRTVAAENMKKEGKYLLHEYGGVSDPDWLMTRARNSSIRPAEKKRDTKTYQQHYLDVSREHINILKEMYKYEIFLFDYPETPFVDFENS